MKITIQQLVFSLLHYFSLESSLLKDFSAFTPHNQKASSKKGLPTAQFWSRLPSKTYDRITNLSQSLHEKCHDFTKKVPRKLPSAGLEHGPWMKMYSLEMGHGGFSIARSFVFRSVGGWESLRWRFAKSFLLLMSVWFQVPAIGFRMFNGWLSGKLDAGSNLQWTFSTSLCLAPSPFIAWMVCHGGLKRITPLKFNTDTGPKIAIYTF